MIKKILSSAMAVMILFTLSSCSSTTTQSDVVLTTETARTSTESVEESTTELITESTTEKIATTKKETTKKANSSSNESAKQMLENMTLKEKIGQLFIIRPDALDSNLSSEQIDNSKKYGITSINNRMKETLDNYPVGGVCLFSKNITTPNKTVSLINSLQESSKTGLFVGIDEEGGRISRIANDSDFNVKTYKSMEAIGKTKDTSKAKEVGKTIGAYLGKYSFNLDFAPDSDVNTNPNNIVIGDRAFGSEPEEVADMVSAAIQGFHQSNTICCVKHFPGHGDTKDDTHSGFVAVSKSWNEMKKCEIIPFKAAIESGTDMIMVAHITAKNVSNDGLPASMSKEIITNKLRKELGYDGVVITDSMAMGAISQNYSSSKAAVKAISAGADIVLMPESYQDAFDGMVSAVNNGTISEERINESVLRILNLKAKYGII